MVHAIINFFTENTYIVNEDKHCFIIDPGADLKEIVSYIETEDLIVDGILLTHGHFDHILYINEVVNTYQCPVFIHEDERNFLFDPSLNLSSTISKNIVFQHKHLIETFQTPFTIKLNDVSITAYHTPGHTRGGVIYHYKDMVFTGDTLFKGTIGRSDLPTSDKKALMSSLKHIKTTFDDNTLLYPGHGSFTTLIEEKTDNQYLKIL